MAEQPLEPVEAFLVVDDDVVARLGGALRHLCVGLMDEPVRVTVLSRSPREHAEETIGPWPLVHAPRRIWPWGRWSARRMVEELELEPPQVVHCLSAELAGWVHPWCREWDCPLVVHLTDPADVEVFTSTRLPGETLAVVTTPSVQRTLRGLRPEHRGDVRLVPIGIPAESEPAGLDPPERIPAVIVTAPLARESSLECVLRVLHAIVQGGQEVQLFFLAGGPAEAGLRRLVDRLGLRSQVTFAGPMRDWSSLNEALSGADFYILPAVPRRFDVSRLAALANGLTVIAPTGTTEDYLIDGTTASLFDPQRPQQLAEKWGALLQDRETARRLARSGLEYVRAHHQASSMVTSLAGLYREAAAAPRASTASGR